ncbi:hypothetical protein [Clostridium lacusfryxellense]|uniref:hypothetical protein n=1 Tax=Clostridium lacusfryxellense TaxID=205328 RepID=UPI001C0C0A03|nr:hypothetical protein [Clostridium lacusfryxellense]MBU3112362.1 hypothetical protein [Clostridium lacusfryxellense]
MTTITGKFIQDILQRHGKAIGDNEDKEINLGEGTTVISSVMEKCLLEALEKLGKTEIDKEVLVEVEKRLKEH